MIIKFKILFQKLCHGKGDWDEVISDELGEAWCLISALPCPCLFQVRLGGPLDLSHFLWLLRCLNEAVVYLLVKSKSRTTVSFVAAKTRVAPLQAQTIPRLELLSAFLLSKLITSAHHCLQHEMAPLDIQCYTDSQVALYWIYGRDNEWKPFVQNIVKEIRCRVHPDLWNHCPGVSNPADLPSRSLTMSTRKKKVVTLTKLGQTDHNEVIVTP